MKRLLLVIPFLLASPALAADLGYGHSGPRDVYIERQPHVIVEHHYYGPQALYDDMYENPFRSHVWYPRRYTHHYYPRPRHFHRRHHRHHHHW
jgi:hypothetical protein